MAAPVTLSAILKTIQADGTDDPDVALVRESALLSSIKHEKDFHGEKYDWSVPYAGLGGRSHTATNAEANDVNGNYARFSVGLVNDFKRSSMKGDLVRRALKGGITTEFVDYVKGEFGLARAALSQNLATRVYRSKTGRRGVIGSTSTTALTLATVDDAAGFYVGDKIVASATEGGTLRDSGDFITLTAVNTETGVLTGDANWSNIASIANGDSLYVQGDNNLSYFGLGDYVPSTAPSGGDAVFGTGVDRSVAVEQLAGIRLTTTGYNVETVLIKAMAQCRKKPGAYFNSKSRIFCSEEDFANLRIAKEGSRFVDTANQYQLEVEGFMVGSAKVIPDVFAENGTFYILGENALELHSNDGVQIDNIDSLDMRKAAGDTYVISTVFDGNFICPRPAAVARGSWPSS